MPAPLVIELFAGSFGWSAGWLALGGRAIGFDIEHHPWHGPVPEGAELVLQDVLTLHGSQFRNASLILASPPCQNYSYLAMPWSRSKSNNSQKAKAMRKQWETEGPDNRLFDACFRIQREASEAAGHHIPMVVENVRGAQPWVGRAAWSHGSFYLWGDVPALMPFKLKGANKVPGFRFDFSGSFQTAAVEAQKVPVYSDPRRNGGKSSHLTCPEENMEKLDGTKIGGDWFRDPACHSKHGSRSQARKAASAMIARIPEPLSSWVAQVYWPK